MNIAAPMTTAEVPEFHYCGRCGVLVEGGRQKLQCRCRKPQPEPLHVKPANPASFARVRDAIARGGRVKVSKRDLHHATSKEE